MSCISMYIVGYCTSVIYKHLAEKFAKWQLPDKILFVDNILKTSVGKIDKKNIRERYKNIYKVNGQF